MLSGVSRLVANFFLEMNGGRSASLTGGSFLPPEMSSRPKVTTIRVALVHVSGFRNKEKILLNHELL